MRKICFNFIVKVSQKFTEQLPNYYDMIIMYDYIKVWYIYYYMKKYKNKNMTHA